MPSESASWLVREAVWVISPPPAAAVRGISGSGAAPYGTCNGERGAEERRGSGRLDEVFVGGENCRLFTITWCTVLAGAARVNRTECEAST